MDKDEETRFAAGELAVQLRALFDLDDQPRPVLTALALTLVRKGYGPDFDFMASFMEGLKLQVQDDPFSLVGSRSATRWYYSREDQHCDQCGSMIERGDLFCWVAGDPDQRFSFCERCSPEPDERKRDWALADSIRRDPSLIPVLNKKYGWELKLPTLPPTPAQRVYAVIVNLSGDERECIEAREIADRAGVDPRSASHFLSQLARRGAAEQVGRSPSRWRILEEASDG